MLSRHLQVQDILPRRLILLLHSLLMCRFCYHSCFIVNNDGNEIDEQFFGQIWCWIWQIRLAAPNSYATSYFKYLPIQIFIKCKTEFIMMVVVSVISLHTCKYHAIGYWLLYIFSNKFYSILSMLHWGIPNFDQHFCYWPTLTTS